MLRETKFFIASTTFHFRFSLLYSREKKTCCNQQNSNVGFCRRVLYIFIFCTVVIKNASLAGRRELGDRERHTRNVGR